MRPLKTTGAPPTVAPRGRGPQADRRRARAAAAGGRRAGEDAGAGERDLDTSRLGPGASRARKLPSASVTTVRAPLAGAAPASKLSTTSTAQPASGVPAERSRPPTGRRGRRARSAVAALEGATTSRWQRLAAVRVQRCQTSAAAEAEGDCGRA